MKTRHDFAVFILTHGRAHNVMTYGSLRKHGYTGKIFLIVDDEDSQADEYRTKYGSETVVFPKQAAVDMTDAGDNHGRRNSVVFARNYCWKIAESLGLKYFVQMDDDYSQFRFTFTPKGIYAGYQKINDLNAAMEIMLRFYEESGALTIAMSQGGDYIGGENSAVATTYQEGMIRRKAMNSFFCSVERPFKFVGVLNDDVNTYILGGIRGDLFLTVAQVRLEQARTQRQEGGLTKLYLDSGTYVKSFFTVMMAPSCCSVMGMGNRDKRLHHRISWAHAAPCIISEEYRKESHA